MKALLVAITATVAVAAQFTMKQLTIVVVVVFSALAIAGHLSIAGQVMHNAHSVFALQQSRSHLGQGDALSPDGTKMVYIGEDNALHLMIMESREDRVLLKQVPQGLDVFDDPCFSPDGTRIVFTASGGTKYYRSDAYSIGTDGTGLTQVTASRPANDDRMFSEYFHRPKYSPDGLQIMVGRYDTTTQTYYADVLALTGYVRRTVGSGRPLFWSASGNAIFVAERDHIVKIGLAAGGSEPVAGISEPIFGKLPAEDVFAIPRSSRVGFAAVQGSIATPREVVPFPVTKSGVGSDRSGRVVRDTLKLESMHFDGTAEHVLLTYMSDRLEIFELFSAR